MELSQKLLCFLFLISFGCGLGLGAVYDVLRIFRIMLGMPRGTLATRAGQKGRSKISHCLLWSLLFVQDLLFAILCGIFLILILYFINDGQIRLLAPLGLGCGFFVYYVTIGRLVMRVSEVIIAWIHRAMRLILTCLLFPARLLWRLLEKTVVRRARLFAQKRQAIKQARDTQVQITAFIEQAGRGFDLMCDPHRDV